MTRLLISVRSLAEFQTAVAAGADVIDIKEPTRGSLGRADWSIIRQIVAVAPSWVTISVALGELTEAEDALCSFLPGRIDYVKFGLAGCSRLAHWRHAWQAQIARVYEKTSAVAVAYADAELANSPPIEEVIATGAKIGCKALLIDTYHKHAGSLLKHLSLPDLSAYLARARDAGLLVALAGSLDANAINALRHLEADFMAFRSAACRGTRTSTIDRAAIRTLANALAAREISST